jgi:iron complex transport system substrate-binding protein
MFEIKPIKRIVCLTEETTEFLYDIGADDLIVGITKYTKRPAKAIKEKPIVSRYLDSDIQAIIDLNPDLVIAWSDLQADTSKELIKQGIEVICFNHRSINGILSFMQRLGYLINKKQETDDYLLNVISHLNKYRELGEKRKNKPKVYFEEWFDPLIVSIQWVSEIIELCGGINIFSELASSPLAKGRILETDDRIFKENPDIILASWCGKPFRKKKMLARENWYNIKAVEDDQIFEIKSEIILQPGPASLIDGVKIISKIFDDWEGRR